MIAGATTLVSLLLLSGRAGPVPPDMQTGRPLGQALERALAEGWRELRIEAECRVEGRLPRVEVFGSGVGIWNGERQFRLSPPRVRSLLVAIHDAGFASMRPSYGGKRDLPSPGREAPRLTCRVGLSLDGVSGESVQLQGGRQSVELRGLAERILGECRKEAEAGTVATDLDDGLAKVASGVLAPEVLQVLVSRRPETGKPADAARSWVLRVEGRTASLRGPGREGTEAVEVALADREAAALAGLLRQERVADLPQNLYAEELTDLVVQVLAHEKKVQARRFAGMTRATHGEAQERLERILAALVECGERWLGPWPPGREQ